MKIYEFKWKGGEKDWVFAPDISEARKFYASHTGQDDFNNCQVTSIPKKEWVDYYILDPNETEPDPDEVEYNEEDYSCGYKIEMSFKEYAEQNTATDMIATTEF